MRITTSTLLLSLAALSFAGCNCAQMSNTASTQPGMKGHGDAMMHMHESPWANLDHAVAVFYPTAGNSLSGSIFFDQTAPNTLHIHGTITGLAPNSTHACHIHEFGDATSSDGMSTGSHYDPEGTHHHGAPGATEAHHAGDFGNLTADASGNATLDLTVTGISIAGMKDPILGRAVILHAKPDDFSQPVGNAGGRIGVAIIGVANPKH